LNESCHACEWVMWHMIFAASTHDFCSVNKRSPTLHICHTYEWVMSCVWMSHVTHMKSASSTHDVPLFTYATYMNESGHACKWVMWHIWFLLRQHINSAASTHDVPLFTYVTHLNESCRAYEWVMSHTWILLHQLRPHTMSHSTHISHKWMSHVARMNESCHTYKFCCVNCVHTPCDVHTSCIDAADLAHVWTWNAHNYTHTRNTRTHVNIIVVLTPQISHAAMCTNVTATHCNTLQHTATQCLKYTRTRNTQQLQHTQHTQHIPKHHGCVDDSFMKKYVGLFCKKRPDDLGSTQISVSPLASNWHREATGLTLIWVLPKSSGLFLQKSPT